MSISSNSRSSVRGFWNEIHILTVWIGMMAWICSFSLILCIIDLQGGSSLASWLISQLPSW